MLHKRKLLKQNTSFRGGHLLPPQKMLPLFDLLGRKILTWSFRELPLKANFYGEYKRRYEKGLLDQMRDVLVKCDEAF